jgi:hypothetical protein
MIKLVDRIRREKMPMMVLLDMMNLLKEGIEGNLMIVRVHEIMTL